MGATTETRQPTHVAKIMSFLALLAVIGLFGVLFYRVMSIFLLPLFLAALLVVIFGPAYAWWLKRLGNRRKSAATVTCVLIVLTILLPLGWAVVLAINEGIDLAARDWSETATQLASYREKFGLGLPMGSDLERAKVSIDALTISDDPTGEEVASLQRRLEKLSLLLGRMNDRLQGEAPPADADRIALLSKAESAALHWAELQTLVSSLTQVLADAQGPAGMSSDQEQTVRELLQRLNVRFRRFRQEMLGGTMRAWIIELVNPDASELRAWQESIGDYLQHQLLSVTGQTTALLGRFLFGTCIMVIATFYFFLDGPGMLKTLMRLSPIEDRYEERLLSEFANVSRAVVVATLLSAVAQGLLAGVGYFFSGAGPWFLLVTLTTILAMVPFVGAAAVWLPASMWLAFVDHRIGAGIGLALYGALVVSIADNVIKPYVLHGRSNIHPLLGLLSVLGGVKAMGPIGILVGPMLVAFLQATLTILRHEMDNMDRATDSKRHGAGGPVMPAGVS